MLRKYPADISGCRRCYIEGKKVSLSLPFNINGLLALPLSMPRELSVFDRVVIDHEILFVPIILMK